jgi:hypothetical protein
MTTAPLNPVVRQILDSLGLKNVVEFNLRMAINEVVTVNVKYFPEVDEIKQLPAILAEYELVLKKGLDGRRD